jgi:hypothetical protein
VFRVAGQAKGSQLGLLEIVNLANDGGDAVLKAAASDFFNSLLI